MKKNRKLLSLLLALIVVFTSIPAFAYAGTVDKGEKLSFDSSVVVNPIYKDTIDEDELAQRLAKQQQAQQKPKLKLFGAPSGTTYYDTSAEAGAYLRSQLVQREASITLNIIVPEYELNALFSNGNQAPLNAYLKTLVEVACIHTGVPDEGDYLSYQWGGYGLASSGGIAYNGEATIIYTFSYFTSRAEEDQVDAKVEQVLTNLNLNGLSNYEKIKSIYTWMCENITYDFEPDGETPSNDPQAHSAYKGLINNTCVCQGYACILYRFALENGIDARVVSGNDPAQGGHAWNVVQMGSKYYLCDSTWDSDYYMYYKEHTGTGQFNYFLKGKTTFEGHNTFGWSAEGNTGREDILTTHASVIDDYDYDPNAEPGPTEDAHTHDNVEFTKWTSNNSLPTEAGNYYLDSDVTLTASWNVPSGTTGICLNGHIIKAPSSGNIIIVGNENTFNLYDCGTTEHLGYLDSNNKWNLGDAPGSETEITIEGGLITGTTGNSSPVSIASGGEFNMYGGNIVGNKSWHAGGVVVNTNATFVMNGGLIAYNRAYGNSTDGNGGAVNLSGLFTMNGGTIKANTAQKFGGGVCVNDVNAVFNMNGGVIEGCLAKSTTTGKGGGVCIYRGKFNMSGGSIIGNTAANAGNQIMGTPANNTACKLSGPCIIDSEDSNDIVDANPDITELDKTAITLNKEGGSNGSDSVEAIYGSAMTTITVPTRTGYEFKGYFDASAGGTQYYKADGTSAKNWNKIRPTANLYGQWIPIITFTLSKNGGTGGTTTFEVTNGAEMPTITPPTKSGSVFNGYFDGDTKVYNADGTPVNDTCEYTANVTLVARWEGITEVADVKSVDSSLSGAEKTLAETILNQIEMTVGKRDGQRHMEDYVFEREEGDTNSHELYYKSVITAATETSFTLDIKPMDKVSNGGELIEEREIPVEDGKEFTMTLTLPESMSSASRIFIKHIKENGEAYFDKKTVKNGCVTFKNTHGFSEFTFSTEQFVEADCVGHSLLLGGSLGINFYMDIPEEYASGEMDFTISGKGSCTAHDEGIYDTNNHAYKFTCYINSLQMADEITAKFTSGDYKLVKKYSVAKYIQECADSGSSTKMKDLAAKIYNYGYYAQNYLSPINGFGLGTGSDEYAAMSAPTVTPDTSKDLSSYDMIKDDNGDTNISDAGISLSLDSSVSLQIHYTLSGDAYSDITPSITVDGEYLGANDVDYSQDGGEMIATIKNIPATKFGHVYEIVVGDNGYTVNASVLTYAHKLKVSSVENIAKQFACALYEYYASTMNYKGLTIE